MNPDIVLVGFAATDGPGAPAHRHRRWWLLSLTVVLLIGGAAAIVVGVVQAIGAGLDVDSRAVAVGRVAALEGTSTPAVTFTAVRPGRYTVWLRTDAISNMNNRETVVAATNCRAAFPDGSSSTFRGAIQGSNVTIGDRSTVGTFTAPEGRVAVACRIERFGPRNGYRRLRSERDFVVVPGGPGGGFVAVAIILGGTSMVVGGVLFGVRWRAG